MSETLAALVAAEALPPAYLDTAERYWRPLAAIVARGREAAGHPIVLGVNGPQGSGKSTLCLFLERLLAEVHGLRAATLSLDDLYLTGAERRAKADAVHPLLATRGPPGTHDVYLGLKVIADMLAGKPALLPRFDKAADDRAPVDRWQPVPGGVDVVLLEGWCVGARPQDASDLQVPVNPLEESEDPDGRWRAAVNAELAESYLPLFGLPAMLVLLRTPGFGQVREWRAKQEAKLRARTGRGMDEATLDRFIQHYERLTRHMQATLPAVADVVVDIDADHRVTGLSGPACPARPPAS